VEFANVGAPSFMPTPQTIQIFLPGGDPRGIRIAEITTRIVQVIDVPRSLLGAFLEMPESAQVAVYFLLGESEDGESPLVYVGQTGDLRARLSAHNKEKDFWERALVLVSRTNSLTQTHALYLEWHCLQQVRKAERYADANGNGGSRPHTPAPLEADCLEIYETGRTLLATLGYSLFDPVAAPVALGKKEDVFHCRSSEADGQGVFTPEGFVVLKGSSGRARLARAAVGTSVESARVSLLSAGVLAAEGDRLVFRKDHLFRTPSGAATAVLGRHANGWTEWKLDDGRTLDEVKRQPAV